MNSWKGFALWPDAPAVTVYSRTIHGITAQGSGIYSDKMSRSEFKVRSNLVFSSFNWGKVSLFLDEILWNQQFDYLNELSVRYLKTTMWRLERWLNG